MPEEEKNNNKKRNIVFCCLCLVIALVAIVALVVIKNSSGDSFTPSGTVGAVDDLSIFPTKDSMAQEFFDADTFIGETDDEELDINEDGRAEDFSNLESSGEGENVDDANLGTDTRIAGSSLTYSNGCWHKKGSRKCYTGWVENFNFKGCNAYLAMGVKKQGWLLHGGNYYYLSKDPGLTGCRLQNQPLVLDKKTYWFASDGKMWRGWLYKKGSNDECNAIHGPDDTYCDHYYYYGPNGVMRTGWQTIGGKKYYFAKSGVQRSGFREINDKIYYFGKYESPSRPGGMQTGLNGSCNYTDVFSNEYACYSYYFDKKGVMKTGWQKIDGKIYYFNKSGTFFAMMGTKYGDYGAMRTGWRTIGGKKYYFGPRNDHDGGTLADNYQRSGWQYIDRKWYYFDKYKSSINPGGMRTGLQTIASKKYYFDNKGIAQKGWITVSNKRYYFGNNFAAYSNGWYRVTENGQSKSCHFNRDSVLERCKK